MNIKELGSLLSCLLPITKLTWLRYMFGTEAKMIIVKKESVLIRTGGGYCSLEEHIQKYALVECLIIWRAMQQKNITFHETVINLLELHQADQAVID